MKSTLYVLQRVLKPALMIAFVVLAAQVPLKAQITVEPLPATVCEGGNASFSVTAINALSYQWQVFDGGVFVDMVDTVPFSGSTTATLSITGAPYFWNQSSLRCIVTLNGLPTDTSGTALLLVRPEANILSQPLDQVPCEGDTRDFSFALNGAAFLNFQWQTNTGAGGWTNVPNAPPFSFLGTNNQTLRVSNIPGSLNNSRYRCIVSSSTCGDPDTTLPATLFVNRRPQVTTEPTDTNICLGNNASFIVTAIGSNITYRWQIDTGGTGFVDIVEATPSYGTIFFGTADDTLFVPTPPLALNGARFRCIIDGLCTPTDTSLVCQLNVGVNPATLSFASGPTSQCSGNSNPAVLYTVAPVYPGTAYTWSYTGSGITINPITPGVAAVTFGPNATSGSLRVTASNGCATSPLAFRNVIVNPTYSINDTITICPGDSALIFGVWRSAPGNYSLTLTTVAGCDSALNINLRVGNVYNLNNTLSLCSGDSAFIGGGWQTIPGTYTDNFQSVTGCDSTVNTTLTVFPSFTSNNQLSICQGDSIFLQGDWQTTSGIYTESYLSINGCDSIINNILTVDPLPVVTCTLDSVVCIPALPLTLSGGTPAGGTWSGSNVTGGVFNTTVTGLYSINYSYSDPSTGCTAVATDVIEVRTCAGLSEFDTQGISIYPNPARNTLFINFSRPLAQDATYIITDINGRLVATSRIFNTQTQLDVENLEKGVYMLTLLNDGNRTSGRIVLID